MERPFLGDAFESSLTRAALDTLPLNVAVLATDGEILGTNEAWREFATANDYAMRPDSVGVNYLDVCDRADDPTATEAAAGIRDVIAGDEPVFTLEYPCHSPDERRWFLLRATRFAHDGTRYVSVAHVDITERKLAELEAERTAEELADERGTLALLNQLVRHDVRNDANAIAGWAGLLADSLEADAASKLRRIETTADRPVELTTTAADLARTLDRDADGTLRPIDLTDVLGLELDKLRETGAARSKRVEVDASAVPDDPVWVTADEMLSAVFSNVLNNAVFHSPADPVEVTVTVERGDDAVEVAVADNGPGIPDSAKESVFGRGEKGLASDGTGLGLYLVDRLAERYGGEVELSDNAPTGTVVHLTFRRAAPPDSGA